MANCGICGKQLDVPFDVSSLSCAGDCVQCLAEAGDPDCQEAVKGQMAFKAWLADNAKYTQPQDMDAWLEAAFNAGAESRSTDDYFGTYDPDDCLFALKGFYPNEAELLSKGKLLRLVNVP